MKQKKLCTGILLVVLAGMLVTGCNGGKDDDKTTGTIQNISSMSAFDGMLEEDAIDYGKEIVLNGFFDGIVNETIEEEFDTYFKGYESKWSGELLDDGNLSLEYTVDKLGTEFDFTVFSDGRFQLIKVLVQGQETDVKTLIDRYKTNGVQQESQQKDSNNSQNESQNGSSEKSLGTPGVIGGPGYN